MSVTRLENVAKYATYGLIAVTLLLVLVLLGRRQYVAVTDFEDMSTSDYIPFWRDIADLGIAMNDDSSANVTVIIFFDPQCPICRSLHRQTIKPLLSETMWDDVQFFYVGYPLEYYEHSKIAVRYSICAASFGTFSSWIDNLYEKQDSIGNRNWKLFARDVGIKEIDRLEKCTREVATTQQIQDISAIGEKIDIHGVPTIIIDGWLHRYTPSDSALREILHVALGNTQRESEPHPTSSDSLFSKPLIHSNLELQIGDEQDVSWTLQTVGNLIISDDGGVLVSQPGVPEIRIFGHNGEMMATIGRIGEGPGEFASMDAMTWQNGKIIVNDNQLLRTSVFEQDGTFLESKQWSIDLVPFRHGRFSFFPNSPRVVFPDGTGIVRPNILALPDRPTQGVNRVETRVPFLKINADGRVVDTLAWEENTTTVLTMERRQRTHSIVSPFDENKQIAVTSKGTIVEASVSHGHDGRRAMNAIRVWALDPMGDTAWIREYEYRPIPATRAMVKSLVEEAVVFSDDAELQPSADMFYDELARRGAIRGDLPAFSDLHVGQDDIIWLRRDADLTSAEYAVLDMLGNVRGTVRLPRPHRVTASRDDVVYAIAEGALGVPVLYRYRIEMPEASKARGRGNVQEGRQGERN